MTGGLAWIAGVMVNYIKIESVRGTWVESHFRWQLKHILVWLVVVGDRLYLMAASARLACVGYSDAVGESIGWSVGSLLLNDGRPIIF